VWVSGQHCEKEDCSPWNVSPVQLALVSLPFVPAPPPGLPRPAEVLGLTGSGVVHVGGDAVDVGAVVELCARYALLQCFNDHLLSVLPLQSLALLATAPTPAPAVASVPLAGGPGGFAPVALSSLGELAAALGCLRGSVFLHTKKQVLATVLDRTQTRTKPADDDYDYPEELPQVWVASSTARHGGGVGEA
jgi:hypothetical protein